MPVQILFGDVEIINIKTNEKETVKGVVFRENSNLTDSLLVGNVLKRKPKQQRDNYRLLKLCKETAKQLGTTID
jgi:hypothetical protein